MSEALKIRLAARCEAAGRPENEDNFQVAEDLSISNTGFTTDKIFPLGSKGTLLLVCDGMGGMNAGEVASAVGVETIKNLFAPQLLTNEVLANDESICMYMKRAIIKADSRIKEEASKDAAKNGMGSTAVMAWLLGNKVYVAWCGDSRCYRYNPATGLEQLSHDHSYVQDLVDTGQLSADLAFDHPNKNIITRSLGDPRGAAKPDAKVYNLQKGDVVMLCSDGLSDSLRDGEIEQSIARSIASMGSCRDALWNDSKQAGWHDNVTIVLAQVIGEKVDQAKPQTKPQVNPSAQSVSSQQPSSEKSTVEPIKTKDSTESSTVKHDVEHDVSPATTIEKPWYKKSEVIITIATLLFVLCCGGLVWHFFGGKANKESNQQYEQLCQSIREANFCVSVEETEGVIKNTRSFYDKVIQLEETTKIDKHQSADLKKIINDKITERQQQLLKGTEDEASVADRIKKYKIE